ncbi:MAG: purine-nucleoside phosphorylase [Candidatus Dadabacteria bacterium]|nr:MAG: purine-nucleoside phosphorylase [Candidatus Dadabacteria bacterium]
MINREVLSDGDSYIKGLKEAVAYLREHIPSVPRVTLVTGSGLGNIASAIENRITIPFGDIPHFPLSTVKGHEGNLIFGSLEGQDVAVLQGRVHLYEGYPASMVAFPVRSLGLLGSEIFFATNSAGGLNGKLKIGDLMLITNHISLFGDDPTIGVYHPELGELFYDVYEPYDPTLCNIARAAFEEHNIPHGEGTYSIYKGCSYETKAEIEMLRRMGADAVGKSTVPEVLAAKQLGMRVVGISCITADVSPEAMLKRKTSINHKDILEAGKLCERNLEIVIKEIFKQLHEV